MLRTTVFRTSDYVATPLYLRTVASYRSYSIAQKCKETLHWVNLKLGRVAAKEIEVAETVAHKTAEGAKFAAEEAKLAADIANKTTGKVLVEGIELGEKVVHGAEAAAHFAEEEAEILNKKTGKILVEGIELGEKVVHGAEAAAHLAEEEAALLNKKTGKILADGIEIAQIIKHRHDAISKVKANKRGYASLQDKGAKVETEQNRPDDGL